MKIKRKVVCLASLIVAFSLLLGIQKHIYAATPETGRVLFISSYDYSWSTVQIQIEGLLSGMANNTTLDFEFMCTKRIGDRESIEKFKEGLEYRLSRVAPYDVVLLGDDAALEFALEFQEELFDGVPLIFFGVNNEELALEASQDPKITGLIERLPIEKNIEFGLTFTPNAKKVVAIVDGSVTGISETEHFLSVQSQFPNLEFSVINSSELTEWDLDKALYDISKDTILLYIVMGENAEGKRYTEEEALGLIRERCQVPAIKMVEGGIGKGLLGGYVVSMQRAGEMVASRAQSIINGSAIERMKLENQSSNKFILDEDVFRKYDIDLKYIPEDSVVLNHRPTFWENYQEIMIPIGILGIVLLGISVWLVYDNRNKRKLVKELVETRSILEDAAHYDFLTRLHNRSQFIQDLQFLIENKRTCTIFMIDIDDFKHINDHYGHTAGDEALKHVAKGLKELDSMIITAYRFAGDEFMVLLEGEQQQLIESIAYKLRGIFGRKLTLGNEMLRIYGSIGIATYPKDANTPEKLIDCADAAMYQVKKNGKNDFAFYSKE